MRIYICFISEKIQDTRKKEKDPLVGNLNLNANLEKIFRSCSKRILESRQECVLLLESWEKKQDK